MQSLHIKNTIITNSPFAIGGKKKINTCGITNTSTPVWIDYSKRDLYSSDHALNKKWDEFVKIRDRQRISLSKQVQKHRSDPIKREIYMFAVKACTVAQDIDTVQSILSNTKKALCLIK